MTHASVIVEDRAGRVLLLLRGPTAPWMPYRWNLPGGGIERGETAMRAAIREAHEESGLRVSALVPFLRARSQAVFHAGRWTGRVRLLDGEHVGHSWVPLHEVEHWDVVPSQREVLRKFARFRARI